MSVDGDTIQLAIIMAICFLIGFGVGHLNAKLRVKEEKKEAGEL
jgi:hypothetical protein